MHLSKTPWLFIILFILGLTWPGGALAQDDAAWIVIETDAARTVSATLAIADDGSGSLIQRFSVANTEGGRAIVQLDPSLLGVVQRAVHEVHHRCGGYTVHDSYGSALSELQNPNYLPAFDAGTGLFPTTIDQQKVVVPALGRVSADDIVNTISELEAFGTRYYQSAAGEDAAKALRGKWTAIAAGRSDVSVRLVPHAWRQNSVVATIQGAELPDEIVVIGAHLDSIHNRDPLDAPGADDDASGVAVVTEVMRVLITQGFRPKRTLEFMAYAAEEVGLRGSGAIAEDYKLQNRNVIAALQMDMTGYRGSPLDMYFITDYVSSSLTVHLKALIAEYHSTGAHRIHWGETACGYGCSDHVSWTRYGYPAAFPFEAQFADYNPNIHTPNDLLARIDAVGQHQARFAKLGVSFMIEMGKAAGQPPAPVPDRYLFTALRVISKGAPRGCGPSQWSCITGLCRSDLGPEAWRGWAGCWRTGGEFLCVFECGKVLRIESTPVGRPAYRN